MHFEGQVEIKADRNKVWGFVTDPDSVAKCAPGVESMEIVTPDDKFKAVASIGLGNLKVRFNADVEWTELDKPNKASLKAHGTAPGSATDVVATMALNDGEDGSTVMDWTAEISVLGTIASLASRMMGSVTEKLTTEFFDCMKSQIEAKKPIKTQNGIS
jgi:carbon monoxide dehydrogenase subunit G